MDVGGIDVNTNAPRFVVELNNNDHHKAAAVMLEQSLRICGDMGLERITLLVPAIKYFSTSIACTTIDRLVQPGIGKALCSRNAVKINGISLDIESLDTLNEYSSYELLVGIYLSAKDLDKLDSPSTVKAVLYLPWTEEEGKKWQSTWEADILGQENWQPESVQLDEAVTAALDDLTEGINLSTGLTHPMDKKRATEMFAKLRKNGLYPQPEDIRRWALRHGWEPKYARELARQAELRLKQK